MKVVRGDGRKPGLVNGDAAVSGIWDRSAMEVAVNVDTAISKLRRMNRNMRECETRKPSGN